MSAKRRVWQAGILAVSLGLLVGGKWAADHFGPRYKIGIDKQSWVSCLPYTVYVVDRIGPFSPQYGDLVQFRAKEARPFVKEGETVIKLVVGVPGDHITIQDDGVYRNGLFFGALTMSRFSAAKPEMRSYRLAEGQYFLMGSTPSSYDSRYFGPVSLEQINGKAYVVL